jgi:4-amino-4-deoxy-L-arabinose transferase-like glycosyltransferase
VGLLALYAFSGAQAVPFHGDESMQIFMSRDYAYQFIQNDWNKVRFDPTLDRFHPEQGLRLMNGTINKYSIGLAWNIAGLTIDDLNPPWLWDQPYTYNVENNFYPREAVLAAARVPSTLFLIASVIVLFFAAKSFAGRPVAYMATLYYALNPAVLLNGRRAMMEGSLLFGALLCLLAGIWLVQSRGWRAWAAALLLALAAGFAVAAKHTNTISVAAVFVGVALHAVIRWRQIGVRGLVLQSARLLMAGLLALGLFLLLNPAWWGDPVSRARDVLDLRVGILNGQRAIWGDYATPLGQFVGLYRQVFVGAPMFFEADNWREPLAESIASYQRTVFAGVNPPGVSVALFALFIIGILASVNLLKLPDIQPDARIVVIAWALITVVFTWLATPIEWQRYYLLVFPVVALLAPLGLVWLYRLYASDAAAHSPLYRRGSVKVNRE